ncbi:MAG: CocE/NonD family hydrolase, partial [Aquihabitans sp.]
LTDGEQVSLVNSGGSTIATQSANPLGGSLFRNVAPDSGYVVKSVDEGTESEPLEVHSDTAAPWDPTVHDQTINASGYQYLTTRDGTQLAINVSSPPGNGPFPTLIEYSGYGYANPAGPQSGLANLANVMGFAVVDVNMRGTGCSGGAFDFFEPLQQLDGYDVIETVSKQPWVLNNQVGMFGISYGGISQLFTAQLNPPSLAAIAPLSVLDATATTLYPGGILNTGFALSWAQGRVDDAKPAGPSTGQRWAYKRIQQGDTTCAANQDLHAEAVNLIGKVRANSHYVPAVADPLDPVTFVHKIKMPVFLACQWQDEQTGGHCPELAQNMTGTTKKWFTFTNGAHIDSLDPATFNQLYDFLKLYVAKQAPTEGKAFMRAVAPVIYEQAMGIPQANKIELPPDPIQEAPTYAAALGLFEQLPEVRVRFENGAGTSPAGATTAGNPYAAFEASFATLPVPGTQARTWYLGPDGTLTDQRQPTQGIDTYTSDASALPETDYTGGTGGGGLWGNASQWKWDWRQNPSGNAASYLTAPLPEDTTVVGKGGAYLWVKSSTPNVDLQATISEVRPDGTETFVQNGWIRASQRKLSTDTNNLFKRPSTLVDPIPTYTSSDDAPMPADEFVQVAIPLYYQGHAYRAGSKIRVTIAAPNGTQPVWAFAETEPSSGTAEVSLAYTAAMPSRLVLPVVPGVEVPGTLPECPSLRSQPCRPYVAFTNNSVILPGTTSPVSPATSTTSTSTTLATSATTTMPGSVGPLPTTAPGDSGTPSNPPAPPAPPSTQGNRFLARTGSNLMGMFGGGIAVMLGGWVLTRRARLQRAPR